MSHETAAIDLETPALVKADTTLKRADKLGLIPNLHEVEVYVLGVDGARKSIPYWQKLWDFWTEYFRKAEGNLKAYSILRDAPDVALK